MKQANNNEVDLLLRSLAKRERSASQLQSGVASKDRTLSNHLDADELNSYAEGVMPATARARYSAHLADCDRCRRLVISLAQAGGATTQYEALNQKSGSGFWQRLAALFSPPVLRYAVPALVLTAVIAISMLALRQQRRSEFVAQNQEANPSIANQPSQTESPPARTGNEAPSTTQEGGEAPANASPKKEKDNSVNERNGVAQVPTTSNVAPTPSTKNLPQSGGAAGSVDLRPSFAPETQAPPPPAPRRPEPVEADKATTLQKAQPAGSEVQERQREEYKAPPKDESPSNRPNATKAEATPTNGPRFGALSSVAGSRAGDTGKSRSDSDAETRKVSGRRFRRQGNAWIDTAYDSSRATTSVARGSEQFRALIADEPGIRAIAEQLGGDVIVVWKGRAYRIH